MPLRVLVTRNSPPLQLSGDGQRGPQLAQACSKQEPLQLPTHNHSFYSVPEASSLPEVSMPTAMFPLTN